MTDTITIRIHGTPVAKGRPRTGKRGNSPSGHNHYTDKKTRQFEKGVAILARHRMKGEPPIDEPVAVLFIAQYKPPPSWPKWRREAALRGEVGKTSVPDLDNLEKAALDAMNGVIYRDDSLIVEKTSRKQYGDEPFVEIIVTPTGQLCPQAKKADLEAAA